MGLFLMFFFSGEIQRTTATILGDFGRISGRFRKGFGEALKRLAKGVQGVSNGF